MKTKKQLGFTLLETLLVLGILGGIMVLAINYGTRQAAQLRRDKTALQMQQILNAGLAYYTAFGSWPVGSVGCSYSSTSPSSNTSSSGWPDLTTLVTAGYLPSTMPSNTFGYSYNVNCDSVTGSVFYVTTQLNTLANSLIIAGEMPVGFVSDENGSPDNTGQYVTAQVTVPGQNLNNARSVNFVGIYKEGACVPVPQCPGYDPSTQACIPGTNCMVPQIMVAPTSVSGVSDTTTYPATPNAYPITSFTAYALAPTTSNNAVSCPYVTPPATTAASVAQTCTLGSTGLASPSGLYWRVCLQVVTGKGVVSTTNTGTGTNAWGYYSSMVVMTRCTPPNEPFGSDFSVYTQ